MPFIFPFVGSSSSAPRWEGSRKRTLEDDDDPPAQRKRARFSMFAMPGELIELVDQQSHLLGNSASLFLDESDVFAAPRPHRPRFSEPAPPPPRAQLSGSTSHLDFRRPTRQSMGSLQEGYALIRQHSEKTMQEMAARAAAAGPQVADSSATKHLRADRMSINFSSADATAWPMSWAQRNIMVFARENKVHYKDLAAGATERLLCNVRAGDGRVQFVACAGADQPQLVAVCTNKGRIALWDMAAKKMTASWSTHSFSAVAWNGPVLSVGSTRGTIRHFDTRIKDATQMKEKTRRQARHQAKICSLAWHNEGKFFASGDSSGTVLAWDSRQNMPLAMNEAVQRRKELQHVGPVTALTWSPWQNKVLASGDSAPDGTGTICIWDVGTASAQWNCSKKLELDATVRSLHFSSQCKELLSVHGRGKFTTAPPPRRAEYWLDSIIPHDSDPRPSKIANSVVVHAYPTLHQLATVSAAAHDVAGSVLSPNGLQIAIAIPEEKKLSVWDVWAKRKDVRRHSSFDTLIR